MPRTFGEILVACRNAGLGLEQPPVESGKRPGTYTQETLADALGVSKETVSRWENNKTKPENSFVRIDRLFTRAGAPESHLALLAELREAFENWPGLQNPEAEALEEDDKSDPADTRPVVDLVATHQATTSAAATSTVNPVTHINQTMAPDRSMLGLVVAIAVLAVGIGAVAVFSIWVNKSSTVQVTEQLETSAPQLSIAAFEAQLFDRQSQLQNLGAQLGAKMVDATPSELEELQQQSDNVSAQLHQIASTLANLAPSYDRRLAGQADLQARLSDSGEGFEDAEIDNASKAVAAGDLSKAHEILQRVVSGTEEAVDLRSRAFFDLGRIAELQIRWTDAAREYDNAARTLPSAENYDKAVEFLLKTGQYDLGLQRAREGAAFARETLGNKDPRTATAIVDYATALLDKGELRDVEGLVQEALAIDRATIGTVHSDYAEHLAQLATIQEEQGRYKDAEETAREALSITEQTLGRNSEEYAKRLTDMSTILRRLDDSETALEMMDRALQISREVFGNERHPDYALRLFHRAAALRELGKGDEALVAASRALELTELTLGQEHIQFATALNWRSIAELGTGDLERATADARQALAISTRVLGAAHRTTLVHRRSLAFVLLEAQQTTEALEVANDALAQTIRSYPKGHPRIAYAHHIMNFALRQTRNFSAAADHARKAVAIHRAKFGQAHSETLFSQYLLVMALQGQNEYEVAEPIIEKVVAIAEDVLGETHPSLTLYLNSKALNLAKLDRADEALEIQAALLDRAKKQHGGGVATYGTLLNNFAISTLEIQGAKQALAPMEEALAFVVERYGPHSRHTFMQYSNLAALLRDLDRKDEAEETLLDLIRAADATEEASKQQIVYRQQYARALREDDRDEEAVAQFRDALTIAQNDIEDGDVVPMWAANEFARYLQDLDRHEEAVDVFRVAVERTKDASEPHNMHAVLRNNLGLAIDDTAPSEAEMLFREALEIWTDENDQDGAGRSNTLINLGNLLRKERRPEEGEALLLDALALDRATVGAGHERYVKHSNRLGIFLVYEEEYERAEETFMDVIAASAVAGTATSESHANYLANLGHALMGQFKYDEAIRAVERAQQITQTTLGADSDQYAGHVRQLASIHFRQGHGDEALFHMQEALAIARKTEEPDAAFESALGDYHTFFADPKDAVPYYKAAIDYWDSARGETSWQALEARARLARALSRGGERLEAYGILTAAQKTAQSHLQPTDGTHAFILRQLGEVLIDLREFDKATATLGLAQEAIETSITKAPHQSYAWGAVKVSKAQIFASNGDLGLAKQAYLEGVVIASSKKGNAHPQARKLQEKALQFMKQNFPGAPQTSELAARISELAR